MRLSTGIISVLLRTGSSAASAFSPDDLPLTVAHRLVLHAIEHQSPISPKNTTRARQLSHVDNNDQSCSICFDGNEPYHPGRRLQLRVDDASGSFYSSRREVADNGESIATQAPLTCVDYESAFLSKLFPDDSSCRAFQVRPAYYMDMSKNACLFLYMYIFINKYR